MTYCLACCDTLIRAQNAYIVVVPDGIDDSTISIERHEDDTVGRCDCEIPERLSSDPHVTDELIPDTVT